MVNDRATITAIKGNSVAWNQLFDFNATTTSGWQKAGGTITTNGNEVIWTNASGAIYKAGKIFYGHKYYNAVYVKCNYLFQLGCSSGSNAVSLSGTGGKYQYRSQVETSNQDTRVTALFIYPKENTEMSFKSWVTIDLTMIYGQGNEPATAEDFENDYYKWFGKKVIMYEPLDSGSIRYTNINGIQTTGFNQWDSNIRTLSYYVHKDSGSWISANDYDSTGYIPVIPNTQYYVKYSTNSQEWSAAYDSYKQYISGLNLGNGTIFTTPTNAAYVAMSLLKTTTNDQISINISDASLNGNYQPYESRVYNIPITQITGKLNGQGSSVVIFPDGMKSANNARDEIIYDGGVTKAIKRVESVKLGTFGWSLWNSSANPNTYLCNNLYSPTQIGSGTIVNGKGNIWCSHFELVNYSSFYTTNTGKLQFGWATTAQITVNHPDFANDPTGFKQWLTNNDVTIHYELKTPKVYIIDNFTLPINMKIWVPGTEKVLFNENEHYALPKLTIQYNAS